MSVNNDEDQLGLATRLRFPSGRQTVLGFAMFMAIAGGMIIGVAWLTRSSLSPASLIDIEKGWKNSISRYGIEPVYPPEEDFAVGDIFVEAIDDTDPDQSAKKLQSSFRSRSVKIDHIDVREKLRSLYNTVPAFGDATTTTTNASPPGLFDGVRHSLPIAALPDISAYDSKSANAAAGDGLMKKLFVTIGVTGNSESQEKTAFRSLVTYGLTSVLAEKALDDYCKDPSTKDNCTEIGARKHLRSITSRANYQYSDLDGKFEYAISIRFFMVSRVYLTSGIVSQTQLASMIGGVGNVSTDPSLGESAVAAQPELPASSENRTTPTQRLEALEKQVNNLRQGGTVGYASGHDRSVAMDQTFARPVAIGFRSVEYDLKASQK